MEVMKYIRETNDMIRWHFEEGKIFHGMLLSMAYPFCLLIVYLITKE